VGLSTHWRWEPPYATHRGAYPQLRCVCLKRWQSFHCNGPFGDTYDFTETRRPQSSVIDRTLDISVPRATDTVKCGVRGLSLVWSWSRRPERSCMIPWTRMSRASSSARTTLSGISQPRFTKNPTQRSSGSVKVWKHTPSPNLRTEALKPLAVDATTISFAAFSLAVRRPGQDARNGARK
jgi:hypothetical protein